MLVDDGSLNVTWVRQADHLAQQDCLYDPVQRMCTCQTAYYDIVSHDTIADDGIYTGVHSVVDGHSLPRWREGLAVDCIAMQERLQTLVANDVAGITYDLRIEAVDQSGNLTEWPHDLTAQIEPGSLTCSGDPCACCLLLNQVNPGAPQSEGGCRDLDGLLFDRFAKICQSHWGGDPALFGTPCVTDSDCDGSTGNGVCRVSPFGRVCPDGFCKSTRCLRP
jgi:hypothetical protein